MPIENTVLDEIQREVKGFGDNVKSLNESMQRDLANVRNIAEDAKNAVNSPEVKAQIDALTTSVATKHEAIEKEIKASQERADKLEAAFKRLPSGDKSQPDLTKDAVSFFEAKAAGAGNLSYANMPTAETVDRDGYSVWASKAGFERYCRSNDDRAVDQKALSVGSNPDGGYFVPIQVSNRIVTKIFETSPVRQLATVETISASELDIPIDTNEFAAGWVGETQTRTETGTAQVGTLKIPVFEIYARPKATQKFLEDASINVEMWIADKIGNKMGRVEATGFVSGTGVNQPRGILSYAAGSGRDKLPQFASGNATGLTSDAIIQLPFQLKTAYMSNGTWLMKRSTVAAAMILKDGDGQYIWRAGFTGNPATSGAPSGVVYQATLCGYSVALGDDMPALGAGALPIAFGDFKAGYTVVDRLGITTLRDPYSSKPFVEFYSRKRVGGAVTDFDALAIMVCSVS